MTSEAIAWIAILLSALVLVMQVLTYVRAGMWNARQEFTSLSATLATYGTTLNAYGLRLNGVESLAAPSASHEQRIGALETRIGGLPTSDQIVSLNGKMDVLEARFSGSMGTIVARMDATDEARKGQKETLARIESYLMTERLAAA